MPFYFRINRLKVISNREGKAYLLFGPDKAEVKLFSFVTTGNTALPNFDRYVTTNDPEERKTLLKGMVSGLAATRVFTTVENVKDNFIMTFGDVGYVVYQAEEIPEDFNWTLIAIESDDDVRDVGTRIDAVVESDAFDGFADNFATLVGAATNPAFAASVAITKFLGSTVAQSLKGNKDDLIGILYMSLNRREHYPHGERRKDGVWDLTNNMAVDYSLFGFEEPVAP